MRPEGAATTLNMPVQTVSSRSDDPDPLIERAQAGDWQAFDQLMRRHELKVLGTAQRLLNTREDAQDAAQEVFLRLYRFLPKVDPQRPLAAWLYRVTVNVCRDLGQRQRRRPTVSLDETADAGRPELRDTANNPAADAELADERRIIEQAITTLTAKERSAFILRDLQGLSTAEVATILDSSEVTIRSHICRARLKIQRFRQRRRNNAMLQDQTSQRTTP